MVNRPISQQIFKELCEVLPGGVNSPVRAFPGLNRTPLVIDSAGEDIIHDVDKRDYIDFCASWGALILGHANKIVVHAITKSLSRGTTFGITSKVESRLAGEVVKLIPSIEKIRFCSSGTEATMYACRLARGYTEKDLIVKFIGNYHGNADFFLVKAGSGLTQCSESSSKGIPKGAIEQMINLPYNDADKVKELLSSSEYKDRIAAVILEPIAGNMGVVPATLSFLTTLREETKKAGALLIFDEVITGFRVGLKGAQELYQVTPDLTCFGKIIGGGFSAAAFGGREEIMNHLAPLGDVYQAGTLSGNPIAMEAGYQVLQMLQKPGFYETMEGKAKSLLDPVEELIQQNNLNMCIQRVGSMFTIFFGKRSVGNIEEANGIDQTLFNHFFYTLFDKGIYIPPSPFEASFIMQAHTQQSLDIYRDAIMDFITKEML